MGKFVVVHPVGKDMAPEAMTPVAKAIKAACTADAYWVKSTYLPEEGKLYCQWDAKDAGLGPWSVDGRRGAGRDAVPPGGSLRTASHGLGEEYRS